MDGEFPEEVCLLDQMEEMDLAGNSLVTTIPACIGTLSEIAELHLHGGDWRGIEDLCSAHPTWDVFTVDCGVECSCCTGCI